MPPPRRHSNADLRRREEFGKLREIGSDMWVDGGGVTYQVCEWDLAPSSTAGSVVTRDTPENVVGTPVSRHSRDHRASVPRRSHVRLRKVVSRLERRTRPLV